MQVIQLPIYPHSGGSMGLKSALWPHQLTRNCSNVPAERGRGRRVFAAAAVVIDVIVIVSVAGYDCRCCCYCRPAVVSRWRGCCPDGLPSFATEDTYRARAELLLMPHLPCLAKLVFFYPPNAISSCCQDDAPPR